MNTRRQHHELPGERILKALPRQHDRLLKIFKDNTVSPDFPTGRTMTAPPLEPTAHSLRGYERARSRRYAFVPEDLR
jgi:hypothetical protein